LLSQLSRLDPFLAIILIIIPFVQSRMSGLFIDYCVLSYHRSWVGFIALLGVVLSGFLILITSLQKWHQFSFYTQIAIQKSSIMLSHVIRLPCLFFSLRQKTEIAFLLERIESIVNTLCKSRSLFFIQIVSLAACLIFMMSMDLLLSFFSC